MFTTSPGVTDRRPDCYAPPIPESPRFAAPRQRTSEPDHLPNYLFERRK